MSFALYLIGYLLFIAGVAGAGVLTGVKNTRHKDPA